MPSFSKKSIEQLATCHVKLQELFSLVVKEFDCTIICGYRNKEAQEQAYKEKKTTKHFPNSKHNQKPSMAVDVAPCYLKGKKIIIPWETPKAFIFFAGYVMGVAARQGIKVRWGGDWNKNYDVSDEKFIDLPHFELIQEE